MAGEEADTTTDTMGSEQTVYAQLIEGLSSHAVFTLDSDLRISSWSAPAESLYGYEQESIVGESFDILFAESDVFEQFVSERLEVMEEGAEEIEHWNERANGSVFWATITISLLSNGRHDGYIVISHDTTARKQYEQMLERQNDRLKEFIDVLSHDLRTPLNVIDGRLDLLRETGDVEHIESIEETTARMKRLVDDLLRVARQGKVVRDPERLDLESVIETSWEGTGAPEESAKLIYEDIPTVSGDADRLHELFENLFRNVVEHGNNDVTVRVGPLRDGFFVEDNGPGIPPERRDDVFDHGVTTSDTGTGYGLSIVRTIVNAHGWDIEATSAVSGGARFEITGVDLLN